MHAVGSRVETVVLLCPASLVDFFVWSYSVHAAFITDEIANR